MAESIGAAAAVATPSPMPADAIDADTSSPASSTSAAGSARVATPPPSASPSSPSAWPPSPSPSAAASPHHPHPAATAQVSIDFLVNSRRHAPPLPVPLRAPPGWAGRPTGPMRAASFPFPCLGPCGVVCSAGTLAQPFRDYQMAGSRGEWQRMCRACYGRMRARDLWGRARALAAYAVLARALLSARVRAVERVWAHGGVGYLCVRDHFEACVHVQKQRCL